MAIDRARLFSESNNAAMKFSYRAIQFAFLLNGAAATCLFAKQGYDFLTAACVFALGAFFATLSMGLAYVAQTLITETWRTDDDPLSYPVWSGIVSVKRSSVAKFRDIAAISWILSMILSFIGITIALIV